MPGRIEDALKSCVDAGFEWMCVMSQWGPHVFLYFSARPTLRRSVSSSLFHPSFFFIFYCKKYAHSLSLTTRHIANPQNVFDESSFFRFLFLLGSSAFFLIDLFLYKNLIRITSQFSTEGSLSPRPPLLLISILVEIAI